MRHRYDESPAGAREESLRRVSRLTWRTGQLGALATVGFAVVFARTAPAPVANVQPAPTPTMLSADPAGPASPTVAATRATVKPQAKSSTRSAGKTTTTAPAGQAAAPQTSQAGAPTAAPPPPPQQAPAPAPSLNPPTTAPAPAPPSSAPAPTVSSASHGGG